MTQLQNQSQFSVRQAFSNFQPKLTEYIKETPTAKQAAFLWLNNLDVFFGGAAGGAKTYALLMAALQYVDCPEYSAILIRDSFANLSMPGSLMDIAFEWLTPTDAHWSGEKKKWTFPSGATLSFGYLDSPRDHFNYQCLSSGHEVLTENGWIDIADVQKNDVIATMNIGNRELEYQRVNEKFKYDYDGKMFNTYEKGDVSFCVTPTHNILFSTVKNKNLQLKKAIDCPSVMRIPQWCNWNQGKIEKEYSFSSNGNNGKTIKFNGYDFAEFLGWFISEGSYAGGGNVRISQSSKVNKKNYNRICELLKRNNITYWKGKEDIVFTNKALCEWLELQCGRGSYNKKIPRECFVWDAKAIHRLIYSLVQGDGTWYHKGRGLFVTFSKQLANDVSEIGLKCGFRTTLNETIALPEDTYAKKPTPKWYVCLNDTNGRDTLIGNDPKRMYQWVDYKGIVYCVNVQNGVFLIRRNGRISFTGNSARFHFVGIDEVVNIRENQALYLFSRLRKTIDSDIPIRFRCASNPPAPEQIERGAWVKDRYITTETREDRVFIPSKLSDNPYIDSEQYEQSLNQLDPVTRKQLLEGDWEIRAKGAMFDRSWFQIVDVAPEMKEVVSFWDLAATEKKDNNDPCYTARCKMGKSVEGNYYILNIIRFRRSVRTTEKIIRQTAMFDGVETSIGMEQEPGASGVMAIDYYRRLLSGFAFKGYSPLKSKIERARPVASQAEGGNVYLLRGAWIPDFLDEVELFPYSKFKDQVDAMNGSFFMLENKNTARARWI